MPDATLRLPARPSLEQVRKQAKELLQAYRAGSVAATVRVHALLPRWADSAPAKPLLLADAQLVLAREFGFANWAKLVVHLERFNRAAYQERYEKLAQDMVASYYGDAAAFERLDEQLPGKASLARFQALVQERMGALFGVADWNGEFTLSAAQLILASQHGFEDWGTLLASFVQPPEDLRATPIGRSATPPFYKIDWQQNAIEPGPIMSAQDWEQLFAVMEERQLTRLNANGLLTDAALKQLAQRDCITSLNFGGTKRITNEGLRHLPRLPQLRELNLSEYPGGQITDVGLAVLRHLPELRRFQMCWQQGVSDAGVALLSFCEQLEGVDLLGTHTGDGAVRALAGKRQLHRLKTGRFVTDAGLPLLQQFPVFKTWQGGQPKYELMPAEAEPNHLLLDGPFTDQGLASLAGLEGLFGLSFFWHVSALTAAGLKLLAALPRLGFLGCEGALCKDEAMRHIAAIPQLRMLMGQGTVASDAGFAALPCLKGLAVSCKKLDAAAVRVNYW